MTMTTPPVSANTDDRTYRYRADSGPLFTSSKFPPGSGLENTCQLPFGFLFTPLATINHDDHANADHVVHLPGQSLPPALCLTCLCYLNMYCDIDLTTGRWKCAVCGATNAAPPAAFSQPGHALTVLASRPMAELCQPLPKFGANNNNHNSSSTALLLVLDANLPRDEAQALGTTLQTILPRMASVSSPLQLGLMVYDEVVSIYQLGVAGMASCHVLDRLDDEDGSNRTLERLLRRHGNFFTPILNPNNNDTTAQAAATTTVTAPLDSLMRCLAAVYGITVENQDPSMMMMDEDNNGRPLTRLERLKRRKEARLRQEINSKMSSAAAGTDYCMPAARAWDNSMPPSLLSSSSSSSSPAALARRNVGLAAQLALELVSALAATTTATTSTDHERVHDARILLVTNGCPNMGDGSCCVVQDDGAATSSSHTTTARTTADGLMLDARAMHRARELFDLVGRTAAESSMGIDVLCTGANELALPVYQALAEPSGGTVVSHDTLVSPRLQANLEYLLLHTRMSTTVFDDGNDNESEGGEGTAHTKKKVSLWDASLSKEMNGCVVDLRYASFLTPTHLIGPGDLVEHKTLLPNERAAFALGAARAAQERLPTHKKGHMPSTDMLDVSMTRFRLGRIDPLATCAVMLDVNDFFQRDEYAVFQCVVRFVRRQRPRPRPPGGGGGACTELVTRIYTHRLSVAKDIGEYLDSVDDEVVPVLLAKEAVYRSIHGREMTTEQDDAVVALDSETLERLAYDAQNDLDATISRISGAFRLLGLEQGTRGLDLTEEGGIKAAGSSIDFAFPPELAVALRRLYHLRRGPLLSPAPMLSNDDRAEMRANFLRMPLEDCLCMMAPSLWTTGILLKPPLPAPTLEPCPPDTLALWERAIVAGDHYCNVFIWSGASTLTGEFYEVRSYVKQFLLQRALHRFPAPQLHIVAEGDSMSRRFTALLAPTHGDPADHQLAHFPALAHLTEAELQAVRTKFRVYDAHADPSFRKWFWQVASATSTSKRDGMSLCE